MSAQVTITQLPTAGPITGTESVPIVQNGQTVQTTTGAIAASPSQTQTFLTLNQEATLPNSRYLSTGLGLGLTDGGAQSFYRISLNRASASLENALTGIVAKNTASSVVARTLQTSGSGISVSDGNGISGNPTFSLTGQVASLANASGAGIVALPNNGSVVPRTITGASNQIVVVDGNGAAGNPTIGIASNPVLPGVQSATMPIGGTSDRPGAPINGMIRYNTDISSFEGYAAGAWGQIISGFGVTSVNASGGTTGLTFSGGPITSAGVLTMAGTLAAASGGTGISSYTIGDLVYASSTTGLAKLALGTATYVLVAGATAPEYVAQSTLSVGYATSAGSASTATSATSAISAGTATNLAGGVASQIPYQTGPGATSFIANGTAGQVLTSAGAGVPVWSGISGGTF